MQRRLFVTLLCTAAAGLPLTVRAQTPGRRAAQAGGPGPVVNALAGYMAAARTRALPEEVIEQAKYHLIDTLAAMISGSELPPGQAAQRYIREHAGKGGSTVVASALTVAPLDAALANGVMALGYQRLPP